MSLTVLVPENDVVPPPADEPRTLQWIPPLDAEGLRFVLERMKDWKPFDVEEVFDDLDTAIGDRSPPVATTGALVDRLRGHLKQLSDIALADEQYPPTVEMVRLVPAGSPYGKSGRRSITDRPSASLVSGLRRLRPRRRSDRGPLHQRGGVTHDPALSGTGLCSTRGSPRPRSRSKRAQLPTREDEHHVCALPAVPHG